MNPAIESRFKKSAEEWDFSTIIGGKVVCPADIPQEEVKPLPEPPAQEVIKPEELTAELNKIYDIPQPVENTMTFESLEDFNRWYLTHREKFGAHMRPALNTLVSVEHLVTQGCKCKEKERRGAAYGYYQKFFLDNAQTDIPATIKSIGGFERVAFKSPDVSEPFLVV